MQWVTIILQFIRDLSAFLNIDLKRVLSTAATSQYQKYHPKPTTGDVEVLIRSSVMNGYGRCTFDCVGNVSVIVANLTDKKLTIDGDMIHITDKNDAPLVCISCENVNGLII